MRVYELIAHLQQFPSNLIINDEDTAGEIVKCATNFPYDISSKVTMGHLEKRISELEMRRLARANTDRIAEHIRQTMREPIAEVTPNAS